MRKQKHFFNFKEVYFCITLYLTIHTNPLFFNKSIRVSRVFHYFRFNGTLVDLYCAAFGSGATSSWVQQVSDERTLFELHSWSMPEGTEKYMTVGFGDYFMFVPIYKKMVIFF